MKLSRRFLTRLVLHMFLSIPLVKYIGGKIIKMVAKTCREDILAWSLLRQRTLSLLSTMVKIASNYIKRFSSSLDCLLKLRTLALHLTKYIDVLVLKIWVQVSKMPNITRFKARKWQPAKECLSFLLILTGIDSRYASPRRICRQSVCVRHVRMSWLQL